MKRILWASLLATLVSSAMIGCASGDQPESAANNAANSADNMGDRAANTADNMGDRAANAADNMGDSAARTADNIGDAMTITPAVKNAITANAKLNDGRNKIDVDTENNVVTLNGTVASEEMKNLAGTVAKQAIADAKSNVSVKNNLTVSKG